jgi:hypothetical protein
VKLSFQGIRREIPDRLMHLFEGKIGKGFIQKILDCSNFLAAVLGDNWKRAPLPLFSNYLRLQH